MQESSETLLSASSGCGEGRCSRGPRNRSSVGVAAWCYVRPAQWPPRVAVATMSRVRQGRVSRELFFVEGKCTQDHQYRFFFYQYYKMALKYSFHQLVKTGIGEFKRS